MATTLKKKKKKSWTYEQAGVPHLKGDDAYNDKIRSLIRSTTQPGVMGNSTGFASLFDLKKLKVKDPILVTATDGVGTKLDLAITQKKLDTIGIDLVAMCVNDLICTGAKPIVFLDYFATGKFSSKVTYEVLKGVIKGCQQAGCSLTGGETAIMPGFYGAKGAIPQFDIAGFSVGVAERKNMIDGSKIKAGDVLIGLASSGFHSNGYSLLRKVFSKKQLSGEVGRKLLTPTKIYVKPTFEVLKKVNLKGIVNITGGGFYDNLPRVIPAGLGAVIDKGAWPKSPLFRMAQESGNISELQMYRGFNMGIGMVYVVSEKDIFQTQSILKKQKISSWVIGEVTKEKGVRIS